MGVRIKTELQTPKKWKPDDYTSVRIFQAKLWFRRGCFANYEN
jgi:hypothetical protein